MTADVLEAILATKRAEVAAGQAAQSMTELKAQVLDRDVIRPFATALKARAESSHDAVIAEIKKASPSAGVIRADFDPPALAQSYERGGATALSVLTDEYYFQGHAEYLKQARAITSLPVLRKDFIIDEWQVWETAALGADALLLIVAALDDDALRRLGDCAHALGLSVLVEVHDEAELDRALGLDFSLIGINNRDLRVFQTDIQTSVRLAPRVNADRLVISESGIHSPADIQTLQAGGIGAFLIGEQLMRQSDPGQALEALFKAD